MLLVGRSDCRDGYGVDALLSRLDVRDKESGRMLEWYSYPGSIIHPGLGASSAHYRDNNH